MTMNVVSEFNESRERAMNTFQELTTDLVLSNQRANDMLMPDEQLMTYTKNSIQLCFKLNEYFTNMVSAFNKAYSNIDDNLNGLADMIEENDETTHKYIQQLMTKMNKQDEKIKGLLDFLTYKTPNTNYLTEANFLINNVREPDGSVVKGKSITEKRLALILEKYDEMKAAMDEQ